MKISSLTFIKLKYSIIYIACINPTGGGKRKGREGKQPIPPPFPNGKGASRLMGLIIFQVNVSVEDCISLSPSGETGEGFVRGNLPRYQQFPSRKVHLTTYTKRSIPPRKPAPHFPRAKPQTRWHCSRSECERGQAPRTAPRKSHL